MHKELELWRFVAERLKGRESVILLVVAESSGSSPGRQGYKMAVGSDGELCGSIGGGLMEVNLVEESRRVLRDAATRGPGQAGMSLLNEQVHRKGVSNASGMICSGKQTVILFHLTPRQSAVAASIVRSLERTERIVIELTHDVFRVAAGAAPADADGTDKTPAPDQETNKISFERISDTEFTYAQQLGFANHLYIIGGGHCALALSEIMSKMDFRISLFDDRPELNTIDKNRFAHEIRIVDSYDTVGNYIEPGDRSYVVVMTLGYASDAQAVRSLIGMKLKYFGVLGSSAKMATMLRELVKEGVPREMLDRIRTPIGLPIHSRTPEEIAISIAAEIISVKNA